MKRCIYCNREIEYKYLLKEENKEVIRCPHCYKKLKASSMSILVFFSLLSLITIIVLISPLKILSKGIVSISWFLGCRYFLKPIIYIYEEE